MKGIVSIVLLLVFVGGCQWATFREHWMQTPQTLKKQGEGRTEKRSETHGNISVRTWRGADGTLYVQPVITVEDPNDA